MSPLGGGSLLLAWQLKGKHVLIVGGGDVASGRIESVLAADARVTLITPSNGLHPLTKRFLDGPYSITYHDRLFGGVQDLANVDLVLTAIDDVAQSCVICSLCRELKIPVNVADIPESCDFYFGSQIRDGPLQIMISTNGNSPKLANIIRKKIEQNLPEHAGDAIIRVGELRAKLKERAPGVGGETGKRRMRWMIDVCTSWEMEELALLDDQMMRKLLDDGWEKNAVPSPAEMGARSRQMYSATPNVAAPGILVTTLSFVAGAACASLFLLARRR
ncbi:siroheme synthase [Rhizopogon vinicolor AM-OR11-026]|uniref:precorrin-2 dehydrogenase n=1 Tax=Rhizopogon vinicolor AM-OR11-026 TaxID=1314800 RepID=A0A1B7MHM4_9AGAM|nr:siroheme synthase [Rhizopogon vinicolor AM-OR11-026]